MNAFLKIPSMSDIVFGNISKTHPEYTKELLNRVMGSKPVHKKELKKPLTYHKKKRTIQSRP